MPTQYRAFQPDLIDRLFARFAAMYGNRFADMWAGISIDEVKKCWADELRIFSVDQVGKAVDSLKSNNFPPTLPEFLQYCAQARRDAPRNHEVRDALPDLSDADADAARERCMETMRNFQFGKPNRDWATKLLDRVERGEWDYKVNGHAPIAIAEAALRNEAV